MTNLQPGSPGFSAAPALPSTLKCRNRQMVLDCFRDQQEHTVADIVSKTGISRLTVMRAIQFFIGKRILISAGKGESTEQGGKRPEFFRFACIRYLLTISMWPANLTLTLFNMELQVVSSHCWEWILPPTPEEAFSCIRLHSEQILSPLGLTADTLYGVSLSTSGIIDYQDLVLKYSVHSPSWGSNIPVGRYLRDIFGPGPIILVENAGKCISRAATDDICTQKERILVLFTSWGLSGALIQSGQILNGRDSLIGEIGHMVLDPSDEELCSCGSHGCVERLVSESRLRHRISLDPPPADSPLARFPAEEITLRRLFSALQQDDPYAQKQADYLADKFAALIRNISLVFNPETVIFVGDYALAGPYFDRRVQDGLMQFHYLSSCTPIELRYDARSLTALDSRGGALALLQHFFRSEALYKD